MNFLDGDKLLNFTKPTDNSIDGVSDRDYALEFLFVSSLFCSNSQQQFKSEKYFAL